MMRIIWLVPVLTSSCWLFIVPTYTPVDHSFKSPYIYFLFISIALFAISLSGSIQRPLPGKLYYFAIPLVIVLYFVKFPYNLGAIVILMGLLLNLIPGGYKLFSRTSAGALITGLIILIQGATIPFLYIILSRYHEIKLLNKIVWPFLRIFGLNASTSDSIIYIPFYGGISSFPGTLEKTGFFLFLLIFLSGNIIIFLSSPTWRKLVKFSLLCIFYGIFRYVILIFLFAQVNRVEIFWNPMAIFLSYLPFTIILGMFLPVNVELRSYLKDIKDIIPSPRIWGSVTLFFISVFCFVGIWVFHDPGIRKNGRILIDEKHSDWEISLKEFDTTWFGSQSTYNYYNMAEYLDYFYHVEHNTDKTITSDVLAGYDILILKTPTQRFEDDEVEAIVNFVKLGGGLWLIGDHTNVFGMDYYLNFIAKRFGMFFHYDSTYDLSTGKLSLFERPVISPHPVIQGLPPFLFATSCTLDAPLTAENMMVGYGLRTRLLSYSGRAFFEKDPLQNYEFGLFLQAAGVKYGKGRVAAFSDSTCFSNFYMFIQGKPELTLGTVEWLNRTNRFGFVPVLLGLLSILCFGGGVYASGRGKERRINLCLFSALPAAALGIVFFSFLAQTSYSFPPSHTDYKQIYFEKEHSDFLLPDLKLIDKAPNNYHTFYVWTQRKGYVPSVKEEYADCFKENEMTLFINPVKPFSQHEIETAVSYVENGGKILVIDGPQNKNSTSNQLLKHFGLKIDNREIKSSALYDKENSEVGTTIKSGTVEGGDTFLRTTENNAVFNVVKKGKGAVGAMANSYLFANPQMGGTQIKPSRKHLKIYGIEFYMIEVMENH